MPPTTAPGAPNRLLEYDSRKRKAYHLEQGTRIYQEDRIECLWALQIILEKRHEPEAGALLDRYLPLAEGEEKARELEDLCRDVLMKPEFRDFAIDQEFCDYHDAVQPFELDRLESRRKRLGHDHLVVYTRQKSVRGSAAVTAMDRKLILKFTRALERHDGRFGRRAREVPLEEGLWVGHLLENHTGLAIHETCHTRHMDIDHAEVQESNISLLDLDCHERMGISRTSDSLIRVYGEKLCAALRKSDDKPTRLQAFGNADTITLLAILSWFTIRYPEWDFSKRHVTRRRTVPAWLVELRNSIRVLGEMIDEFLRGFDAATSRALELAYIASNR